MNCRRIHPLLQIAGILFLVCGYLTGTAELVTGQAPLDSGEDLHIEITKKGLGKEVFLKRGPKEWFMLVEVTPENTVVIRQEKENETYLLDESETHDRPLSAPEVDTIIDDFINSVKTRTKRK